MNITFLGPAGATFTAIAYDKLSSIYGAPSITDVTSRLTLADSNEEILPLLIKNGGFGAIAMETKAEGRVDPPVNSFIELLRKYDKECPLQVIGALHMKINFALMVHDGVFHHDIKTIHAHAKALGACHANIQKLGAEEVEAASNGTAAEDVLFSDPSVGMAALGPIEAARKYGLKVLEGAFEDKQAMTTFFLMGPRGFKTSKISSSQRCLMVFRVKHQPGALVKVLAPFADEGVNLRFIHSLHFEDGVYDFAIITEDESIEAHERATSKAQEQMKRYIQFGPFPVATE